MLSGDVCLNPGPIKHPCSSCLKPVARTPKQLWKTLKQLVPGKSGNVTSIKRVTLNDGSETTHPKEISNTFNSFFVSVGAKLASKFTSDTTKINPPVSRHEFRWTHIETKSVEKIMSSLKNNKATGLDGIGSWLLKTGSPVLIFT